MKINNFHKYLKKLLARFKIIKIKTVIKIINKN